MGNELVCTSVSCLEEIAKNSSIDLRGWPAAVALVGCAACFAIVGCKYINAQAAVHKMSAGMNIA